MTTIGGRGKNTSTDPSPPKVSAASTPPKRAGAVGATVSSDDAPEDFDESAYLAAFPDVAGSIKAGKLRSALHHYQFHGRREGRLTDPRYEELLRADTAGFPAACVDRIYACKDGKFLIWGWVNDDEQDSISKLSLWNSLGLRGSTTAIYRYRRKDVTNHLDLPEDRNLAFWAIVEIDRPETMSAPADVTLSLGSERKTFRCQIRRVGEEKFRELALDHLAKTAAVRHLVENFRSLDAGLGDSLIALNLEVSRRMALGAQTVQIGVAPARPEASIIVCLFGRPDLLMIQCALFSKCRGIQNYEFIYASNSPELA
jgi:hypothetical protein